MSLKKEGAASMTPPRHIAIIMDGNGRWAKSRGLQRTAGHKAGAETFRRIATYCRDIGIEYLTVYAFSTENWKRPAEEVNAIMGLLKRYLEESIEKMERDKVRLKFFGDTSVLSPELQKLVEKTNNISAGIDGIQANICLNYGGRSEILRAVKKWMDDENRPDLTEETFGAYLDSAGVPDPDLLIRPGGEMRLSNFLMWQSAYSELYFTPVLWPDFSEKDIDAAIEYYMGRDRRYGGIKE